MMNFLKVVLVSAIISLISFSSNGQNWEKAIEETKLMFQIYESSQAEYDAHVLNMRKIRTEFEPEISELHQADVQLLLQKYVERLGYLDTLRIVIADTLINDEIKDLQNKMRKHYSKLNKDRTYNGLDIMMPLMAGDKEFKKAAERLHDAYGEKVAELTYGMHASRRKLTNKMVEVKRALLNVEILEEEKNMRNGFKSSNKSEKHLLIPPSINTTASFFVIESL